MMRQVLVDEARKVASVKRNAPLFMTQWPGEQSGSQIDIADLDEALAALTELSPERAEIVELRFMLGMTVEEAATATGQAERTVKRHWHAARAWLLDYLSDQDRT